MKLTQIIEGKTSLLSRGFCTLKLVDGEKVETIDLPIKSTGIIELQERLNREAPKPPSRMTVIEKDSDVAKRLGFTEDTAARVFDLTDDGYIKAVQDYQSDFMWRTAIEALDVEFADKDGNVITDYHRKKEILQGTGISGHHLDAIIKAVSELTKEREEKADFLSVKPSA
jgi:hypothetical protein